MNVLFPDQAALTAFCRKHHIRRLALFVEDVSVVATIGERATLRVTDALTSYDVIGPTGHVVRHGSGRPARQWRVVLVKTVEGWRIWSVTPAT